MRACISRWVRLLFGGVLLFSAAQGSCVSDALRDASEELDGLASELDGENSDDSLSDFFGDLEELFD